ncbi:hypothetical protein Q3O98_12055 [Ralstonia pseudosolanacearum]|uniref:hypothetical protein n=1 Tax=Ralstonia pseudosolanacearum TaxID=1310165 RepID=UPI002676B8FF|nr:hypothetical protein [Ralstonia pseudosolanacearum]MDO3621834.1 hypothetical protein [Ralstonia pseudosolanacearum]
MQQPAPVETHIQIIWSFVRLALLKRVLHIALPHTSVDFWRIMQGTSLDAAVTEWCKIFGNRTDDTHWTTLIPAAQHDAFRQALFAAVGMTAAQWETYWATMKDYRDQLAAHHDFGAGPANFPVFDAALEAAYHYYNTFLYPTWSADHPGSRYPSDMKAYAAGYQDDLFKVATAAAQATKQFEP